MTTHLPPDAQPFSQEELVRMVKNKDRHGLDRYLAHLGCDPAVREFYRRSKPGREGKKSQFTAARNFKLARAKLLYTELRVLGLSVEDARAEMKCKHPMEEETAIKLTEGSLTHINRLCDEIEPSP